MLGRLAVLCALFAGASGLDSLPAHARLGALGERFNTAPVSATSSSQTFWLSVPLTYDDPAQMQFSIRYHVNDEVWDRKDGPIFLEMGGEAGNPKAVCSAEAKRQRALCLCVEHRFFGLSAPTEAQGGASTQNYRKGLRMEFFLHDVAAVVDEVQRDWAGVTPRTVMNFGGSYAGASCLWFRMLYPNKTAGCVSSSGPFNTLLDFPQFDNVVSRALSSPSVTCAESLHGALTAVDAAFSAGHGDDVKVLFDASNLIGSKFGDFDLLYAIADGLAMIVQYGAKAEICSFVSRVPKNASDSARMENLRDLLDHHFTAGFAGGSTYDTECQKRERDFCVNKGSGEHIRGFAMGGMNDRSWLFMTCNEFGFLQSAPLNSDLIMRSPRITIERLLAQCDEVFGVGQADLLRNHNSMLRNRFGAGEPWRGAVAYPSNVLFMEYSDDPWWASSAEWKSNAQLPICLTTCDGCGHCGTGAPAATAAQCNAEQSHFVDQVLAEAKTVALTSFSEQVPRVAGSSVCAFAVMSVVGTLAAVAKLSFRKAPSDVSSTQYRLLDA